MRKYSSYKVDRHISLRKKSNIIGHWFRLRNAIGIYSKSGRNGETHGFVFEFFTKNALRIAFFQTNSRLRSKTRKYGFLPNFKLKL